MVTGGKTLKWKSEMITKNRWHSLQVVVNSVLDVV